MLAVPVVGLRGLEAGQVGAVRAVGGKAGQEIRRNTYHRGDGASGATRVVHWCVFLGGCEGPCYMIARVVVDAYNNRKVWSICDLQELY